MLQTEESQITEVPAEPARRTSLQTFFNFQEKVRQDLQDNTVIKRSAKKSFLLLFSKLSDNVLSILSGSSVLFHEINKRRDENLKSSDVDFFINSSLWGPIEDFQDEMVRLFQSGSDIKKFLRELINKYGPDFDNSQSTLSLTQPNSFWNNAVDNVDFFQTSFDEYAFINNRHELKTFKWVIGPNLTINFIFIFSASIFYQTSRPELLHTRYINDTFDFEELKLAWDFEEQKVVSVKKYLYTNRRTPSSFGGQREFTEHFMRFDNRLTIARKKHNIDFLRVHPDHGKEITVSPIYNEVSELVESLQVLTSLRMRIQKYRDLGFDILDPDGIFVIATNNLTYLIEGTFRDEEVERITRTSILGKPSNKKRSLKNLQIFRRLKKFFTNRERENNDIAKDEKDVTGKTETD